MTKLCILSNFLVIQDEKRKNLKGLNNLAMHNILKTNINILSSSGINKQFVNRI